MDVIDLDDPFFKDDLNRDDSSQIGFENLKKRLFDLADGKEIVLLKLSSSQWDQRTLFLVPVSRIQISIK